jgi:hypothetical protein
MMSATDAFQPPARTTRMAQDRRDVPHDGGAAPMGGRKSANVRKIRITQPARGCVLRAFNRGLSGLGYPAWERTAQRPGPGGSGGSVADRLEAIRVGGAKVEHLSHNGATGN